MMAQLQGLIETFRFGDLVDILSVAVLLYYLYKQISRHSRYGAVKKALLYLVLLMWPAVSLIYTLSAGCCSKG